MNIQEFASLMANHKTGFLISIGDINGDRNAPIKINNIYYDSVSLTDNGILSFSNKHNKQESDGKTIISSYGMSDACFILRTVESIKEYFDDCLSYVFEMEVQRLFEIEIADEHSGSGVYTIGLL